MMTSKEKLNWLVKNGYHITKDGDLWRGKQKLKGSLVKQKSGALSRVISFRKRGEQTTVTFARLAAYQLFGDKLFKKGVSACHRNRDTLDNSHDNIGLLKGWKNARKSVIKRRIFTDKQAAQVKRDRKRGMTYKELAEKYGTSNATAFRYANFTYATRKG